MRVRGEVVKRNAPPPAVLRALRRLNEGDPDAVHRVDHGPGYGAHHATLIDVCVVCRARGLAG